MESALRCIQCQRPDLSLSYNAVVESLCFV